MASYSFFYRVLHFSVAFLVFCLFVLGYYMVGVDDVEGIITLYEVHKALGILVLGSVFLRLCVRVWCGMPTIIMEHATWEKCLSRFVRWVLYILMAGLPMSGWLMTNAAGFPVSFFGMFELPLILEEDKGVLSVAQVVHKYLAFGLLIVVALHIVGALKHHFVDQDETLKRMTSVRLGLGGGFVVALISVTVWVSAVLLWGSGLGVQDSAHDATHSSAHDAAHDATQDLSNIDKGH